MAIFKIGDRVQGKSKLLTGRRGTVQNVIKDNRQHKYDVAWDGGATEKVAARALAPELSFVALLASEPVVETPTASAEVASSNGSQQTQTTILDDDYDSEDSNIDQEVEPNEESDERTMGELVMANERVWTHTPNITHDPRSSTHPFSTKLIWPQWLQLGERQ
jgi:hypothetical protein